MVTPDEVIALVATAEITGGGCDDVVPRISTRARSHWSVVGAVSLMVTAVPLVGVGAFCDWVQKVPPVRTSWSWRVWLAPTVRALPAVQSKPTPNTHELARVVTKAAVGAVPQPLPPPTAPTPDELENAITVSSTLVAWASVAGIEVLGSTAPAGAVQMSAVPGWALVRRARVHVRPPPLTDAVWPAGG